MHFRGLAIFRVIDNVLIDMTYNNGPFSVRVFYQIFELEIDLIKDILKSS